MHLIIKVITSAFALLLAAQLIPGITIDSLLAAVTAALVLGVLHLFVKPVLFVLTLPITILTLGLFSFVINASLFLLAAYFIDGFSVASFWIALLGSVFVSIVQSVIARFI